MSALECWREEIRPLIPRGFLRRDQGDGLLISDFPRFGQADEILDGLQRKDFSVKIQNGMAWIDGAFKKYQGMQRELKELSAAPDDTSLPLYALGVHLARRDVPLERQPMELIRFTLKCLDAKNDGDLMRLLPPRIALLQRQHLPLPALAGQLILDDLFHRMKGAEKIC